jgi:hypothetical protein
MDFLDQMDSLSIDKLALMPSKKPRRWFKGLEMPFNSLVTKQQLTKRKKRRVKTRHNTTNLSSSLPIYKQEPQDMHRQLLTTPQIKKQLNQPSRSRLSKRRLTKHKKQLTDL